MTEEIRPTTLQDALPYGGLIALTGTLSGTLFTLAIGAPIVPALSVGTMISFFGVIVLAGWVENERITYFTVTENVDELNESGEIESTYRVPKLTLSPVREYDQTVETHSVEQRRIMLDLGRRSVLIKISPTQARYLRQRILAGDLKIGYKLCVYGTPFKRHEIDKLRVELTRKELAEWRGNQVILNEHTADAILKQFVQ